MNRVLIFDTTLRDGEQSPGCSMTASEKLRMARQLDTLGVDIMEAGFPAASPDDHDAVREIARQVRRPVIAALARASSADIERAASAIEPAERGRIHVFIATSEIHLRYKLRIDEDECLERAIAAVEQARRYTDDVEFSAEDATRTDPDFLLRVMKAAAEAGATTVNIPDTVGYTHPDEYARLVGMVCAALPDEVTVSVHCHDDLGLAVANSLAAVEAGAAQVECTINGIGERAGNAALEELVMALRVREDAFGRKTGIDTREIYRTSRLLTEVTGVEPPPNKAIVGSNAFAHEAGIHQDGVLKNPSTYEIMTPEMVGLDAGRLVLGKHSGRSALAQRYRELGHELEGEALDRAFEAFKRLADRKKTIDDADLLSILNPSAPDDTELVEAGYGWGV